MRKAHLFVIAVLILAAFLRLFRFETFLEFLDDQGRDALVMKQILIDHHPTLLGPGTSVGKMYLGPLYYYVMTPFMALSYPAPTGPAYAVALMGILTVALIYVWGRKLVGEQASLIAMSMYAVAPIVVFLSRFSWQPNPAPLVGMCMMWLTYQALTHNFHEKKAWCWIGVAMCFAVLSNLHYIALLSALPSAVFLMYDMWKTRKEVGALWQWLIVCVASLCIIVLSAVPLVAFDLRHDHLILQGFQAFFTGQQRVAPLPAKLLRTLIDLHGRSMFMTAELYGLPKVFRTFNTLITVVVFSVACALLKKRAMKEYSMGYRIVFAWVTLSLIGLSVYPDNLYSHYIAFLFPASFLLFGAVLAYVMRVYKITRYFIWPFIFIVMGIFISQYPFWTQHPIGYLDVKRIASDVERAVQPSGRYNIALLNDNREYRGMKYRYFFETQGVSPQSQYDYTNLDLLIVFVENGEDPQQAPIYEIQQFFREHKSARMLTSRSYPGIVQVYVFGK